MCSTKRVRLVFLFLITAAFLAGAPAHAGKVYWTPLRSTGAEPSASGEYCVVPTYRGAPWNAPGDVIVRCEGLTPGATYHVSVGTGYWDPFFGPSWFWASPDLTATRRGMGQVTFQAFRSGELGLHVEVSTAERVVILTAAWP